MTMTIEEQTSILEDCASWDLPVSETLGAKGLTINDLRYATHRSDMPIDDGYVSLDSLPTLRGGIPAVSFFTGAGGMDLGLHQAGFRAHAAFEHEQLFCETLRRNLRDTTVYGPPTHPGDIGDTDRIVATLEKMGLRRPFEGLFHGGPPCQPFSIAANQRFSKGDENFKRLGFNTARGTLLSSFLDVALHFMPRALLVENVPGLGDIDGGAQLGAMIERLEKEGYWVASPMVLNARDYGVPQERKRLFLIAWRTQASLPPIPTRPRVTVAAALRKPLDGFQGHVQREHRADSLLRYAVLEYGQRDKLGRVDRLDPSKPSKTVIAGGLKGGGRSHLHPVVPRTLTPRECAMLQTFPESFEFVGSPARQFTQIGNAVPPVLAYHVGVAIAKGVFGF